MTCYACDARLTAGNRSREHVVNRSIGGHVTSTQLLCVSCNNYFGKTIDAELDRQLGPYGFLLNIPLQLSEHTGYIEMISLSGKKIRVGPGMVPYDTIRILDYAPKPIEFPVAPEQFDSMMAKKKRELERLHAVESRLTEVPPSPEKYFIYDERAAQPDDVIFGGDDCYRSIAKMLLNYYLHNGYPIEFGRSIARFVKGDEPLRLLHFHPLDRPVHLLGDHEISHILHIDGDPDTRLLFGYIELFNMVKLILPFSTAYHGPVINQTYAWDLLAKKEPFKALYLPLVPHHLELLVLEQQRMVKRMTACRERLMKMIERRQLR